MRKLIALAVLLFAGRLVALHPVHAQAGATVAGPAFEYVAAKSSCSVIATTTVFCYAADTGILQSINGAAFVQLQAGPATAGVTSFNGQTGAVVYTPPVVSVNGKTGAVVLSAATQLQ